MHFDQLGKTFCFHAKVKGFLCTTQWNEFLGATIGKDEKLRLTNLEWGVDFLRLTNLVKTSLDGQI